MAETPSIHAWIGGTDAIARWLDAFYDEVERDDLLGPVFGGVVTTEHRGAAGRPRGRTRPARTGPPVGLGRGPAVPALTLRS